MSTNDTTQNTVGNRYYMTLASAYAVLANSAATHDPEAFKKAGCFISEYPAELLNGMSYLSWMLSQLDESDADPAHVLPALRAIAEIQELACVLLVHTEEYREGEYVSRAVLTYREGEQA